MANLTYRQATQEAPVSTTTKNAALTSQEIDGNFKSLNDELITKAPLVSPGLSGVPTAPTAAAGTNTTQLATTAFVQTGLSGRQPLDIFAQTRGYDDILSACTYADSLVSKFSDEGSYCKIVRDETWSKLYDILAEVESGTRPLPESYEEIEPELPELKWPDE